MSSMRAPRRPRRANSARAAAIRASLALGSGCRGMAWGPRVADWSVSLEGGVFLTRWSEMRKRFLTGRSQSGETLEDSALGPWSGAGWAGLGWGGGSDLGHAEGVGAGHLSRERVDAVHLSRDG